MINRIEQFDERFGTLEIDDMRNADAHCAGQCGVLLCDADVPCPGLDSPDCDTDDPRSEIKSMDDYIRDHYERALVANLCQQIERGEVPPEDTRKRMWSTRVEAYPESGRISHITYIRLNQCCFHADILITVDLTIYRVEKGENTTARRTQWYRVEMEVDMETEASIDVGAFSIYRHIEHENACFLTEHLVPYFNTEKLEVEAERILSDYCPGVLCKATNINATDLAETMGLKIIHLPLYNQKKRESVLFFTDDEVLTQESDGAPIVPVRVNARTIVLNESNSSVMLGYTQDAIFHECVHYEEHFLFFRLQEMYCDDTSKLAKWRPRPNVPKEERKWGPVKSMEWQARFGGQFLRMPRTMVQGDAKKFLAETSKDSHNGIRMEKVICRLEDAYRVPRYRAKSRIIQLGFEAAKGAFNYVNDKRLRPFAFALGSSRGGRTFVISMKDAAKLYVVDDAFRDLLNAGHYVYVDGHFCIDDPQFVIHGERSVIMTQWAIEHVDECCLRFEKRYSCTDNDEYCYGMLFSDEAFNEQKLSFFSDENRMTLRGYVHAVQEFCNSLPNEFSKSLVAAMKTRKMTVEQLAEASGIPVRTIERLRSYPYKRYELRRVVILCLALNLPTDVSLCMMKKAGVAFSESDEDKVYELLIRQKYAMPMKTIFGVLEQCGYGEFEAK